MSGFERVLFGVEEKLNVRGGVLVIGASGMVGSIFTKSFEGGVHASSHDELDITDKASIEKALESFGGESILLLAAWTDVEGAQKDPEKARRINVDGVGSVAEVARKFGKHLILVSTDFVFEGKEDNPGPYTESDPIANEKSVYIGEYARSKVGAEKALQEVGGKYAIVRIAYPFGNPSFPNDFVNKTITYLKKGYAPFADQQFTPTYIPDLVRAVNAITKGKLTGVFHVATNPPTTPYEFGRYVAEKIGLDPDAIKLGSLVEFLKPSDDLAEKPKPTPKPVYGGLSTAGTEKRLRQKFTFWKDAADFVLEELDLVS